MSVLKVIHWGHPTLRKVAKDVKQEEVDSKFIDDMFETMYAEDGAGLAAPQVNVSKQLLVCTDGDDEYVLINPKIIATSERRKNEFEGCLSLPGLHAEVPRHEKIVVRFKDENWQDQEITAKGFLAKVFQHEIDHLNGVLYIDRANLDTLQWTDADIVETELMNQPTDLPTVQAKFKQQYLQNVDLIVFDPQKKA